MSYGDLFDDYLFAGQQIRSTLECCCHCQPIGRQSQCNDGLSYLYYTYLILNYTERMYTERMYTVVLVLCLSHDII